jgi:hypothetical protein
LARASIAANRSSSNLRRPLKKVSKSASTAIGREPACRKSRKASLEINLSSKERYCRLPAAHTSPARSRSRSSDSTQSS